MRDRLPSQLRSALRAYDRYALWRGAFAHSARYDSRTENTSAAYRRITGRLQGTLSTGVSCLLRYAVIPYGCTRNRAPCGLNQTDVISPPERAFQR